MKAGRSPCLSTCLLRTARSKLAVPFTFTFIRCTRRSRRVQESHAPTLSGPTCQARCSLGTGSGPGTGCERHRTGTGNGRPNLHEPSSLCRYCPAPCDAAVKPRSRWKLRGNRKAGLFPAVAEIPAPAMDAAARREWLTAAMQGTWQQLQDSAPPDSPHYGAWRRDLLESLAALPQDSVIFTHFIAINVVVGAARGVDDVVCFRPDHASITIAEQLSGRLANREARSRGATPSVLARG